MNRLLKWKWELAAPLLGAAMSLAFAPYDYAYAVLPSLIYLYWAWSAQTPKRAVFTTYLFGLGLFGVGIWWVYLSIHDFGHADSLSAGAVTALLVGFWALFPAAAAWLTIVFSKNVPVLPRILVAALYWVAMEYVRGNWLLNGFPWLQIAYSQMHTPLAGFVPLIGVYGVGFLLAASAFALVEIFNCKSARRNGILFLMLIWGAGLGLQAVQWTHAMGEPIKITLIQGNIDQAQKWLPNQRQNTLKRYQQLTEQHWDSNVIIWPETSIPAFLSQIKDAYLDPLSALAHRQAVDLVVSLPTEGQGREYFNSVMVLGEATALYHKMHLLPFGEYLPLQPLSGWVLDLMDIPLGNFTAGGDRQNLLRAGGFPFVTTICYEDAFGELVARQAADAAYIVNVTNDAWFGDSAEPHQHMQMAQMRAMETGRFLVRAANTGVTAFVRPDGIISKQAPRFTTTTLTDSILPMGGVTPYIRIGDRGVFLLLIVIVLLGYGLESLAVSRGNLAFQE